MAVSGKKASKKFSSTLSQGGAEDFDLFCQICDRADIRLPAFGYCVDCEEHLCKSCLKTHRLPKPLRHHQLLDKDQMPQKQKLHGSSKSTSSPNTGDLTKPCTKHTKEMIKFYCHDHNALLCGVCVTLKHTPTSCHVDYIPDISGQIIDSTEFKKTLTDIDKLTNRCSQITSDLKQRVTTSTTSLKDALVELENFRKEINKRLDKLEKEVKDAATTIQHDNNKMLKTTETTCDDINKSLQASADSLKHLNANKKTYKLFAELKRAQQLIQDDNNIISQLPTINDIDDYIFESNKGIKKVLKVEKSLGTLRSKQSTESKNQGTVTMKLSTPRNFNAKSSSDEMDCWITGIAVSPQYLLFAADYYNESFKMIDIINGDIKKLKLDSAPFDVANVTSNSLAVTLPDSKTLQFISFSSDSLSLKNKLEVDGECYGISHHHRKLAVTFIKPAKLQIMDLKGNTEIKVDKDSNGDNIFSYPWYVTSNRSSVYVSDRGNYVVLRFNWQGEMIGVVGIKEPRGIALIHDGSLLVNGYASDCIHRVSDDCKDSKIALENVDKAWSLCWCTEVKTLCVSRKNNDGDDNYIELYKLM